MKKAYTTPTVEKVEFQYDQIVVASGSKCHWAGDGAYSIEPCSEQGGGGYTDEVN